ncbi:MAG: metallophosphoesterase, partial [Hyphomicrobiales bacterium]|nr:metallophosphoesterase [Hyphomicrobiales bacterium]
MALIAQISDLHVRPRGHPASRVVETNRMTARVVERLAAMTPAPDAVIASGDLVDRGLLQEYEMLREILEPLPMPVYFALGNHDDRGAFRAVFGDRAEFPATGPLRYGVDIGALRLVVLDSLVSGAG